jgi:poly(3-hydroxybutyrate) depolymerase
MPTVSTAPLFAGSDQPARRSFEIHEVFLNGERVPVATRDVPITPFCMLVELARSDTDVRRKLLVVPPLSGHFPILLRDLIVGLIPWFRVCVADWINVRHVDIAHGTFGLEANIATVIKLVQHLGSDLTVVALCQAGVPALAAAATLAAARDGRVPSHLVLIAAPIDPLANPTRVVRLLRSRTLSWMHRAFTEPVPDQFVGRGRQVYPARLQLSALELYLTRRFLEGSELIGKILADDGSDPSRFPFLDLYTSIMDLDARFFLENTKSLYHDCALRAGTLEFEGERIDPRAISKANLMTIEGEWDDIAAPGQTSAAHDLCASLSAGSRRRIQVPGCGHFSLFYGRRWRHEVLPKVLRFSGLSTRADGAVVR